MKMIEKLFSWIRSKFIKDDIITIIVTNKEGDDELWVYKNGKRIQ